MEGIRHRCRASFQMVTAMGSASHETGTLAMVECGLLHLRNSVCVAPSGTQSRKSLPWSLAFKIIFRDVWSPTQCLRGQFQQKRGLHQFDAPHIHLKLYYFPVSTFQNASITSWKILYKRIKDQLFGLKNFGMSVSFRRRRFSSGRNICCLSVMPSEASKTVSA